MNNKIKAILASFFVQISTVAAQNDPIGVASGNGEFAGIIPLITDIFGFQIGGWQDVAVFGATVGVFWVSFYIVIETALRRMGNEYLLEASGLKSGGVGSSGDEGISSRIALFSLLLVVSAFGANGVFGIMNGLQNIVLLAMAFGVIGALLWALGGGLIFSGMGARVTGEGAKEWGDAASDLGNYLEDARERMNNGGDNAGDQEDNLEGVIQDIMNAEADVEEMVDVDIERLQQVINEIEEELELEKDEVKDERKIQEVLSDIEERLEGVEGSESRREIKRIFGEKESGGSKLKQDISALYELIEDIEADEERGIDVVKDELHELHEVIKEIQRDFEAVKEIGQIIEESEADWNQVAQRAGQDEELAMEKNQIEKLEAEFQDLREKESTVAAELDRVIELLESQVKIEKEEVEMLQTEISESGQLIKNLGTLKNQIKSVKSDDDDWIVREMNSIIPIIEKQIEPELERLEDMDERELRKEEEVLQHAREVRARIS